LDPSIRGSIDLNRAMLIIDSPARIPADFISKIDMNYRELGQTGWRVSEVSFGAWAIGGAWGDVDDRESTAALDRAVDLGVNFFDTADVYGDGHSERLLAQLKKRRKEEIIIATKAGRRASPHTASNYTPENLRSYIERSLQNLGVEAIDLVQLHCPPTDVFYRPEVFEAMDRFVREGKIRCYGVSVERVEEALKSIEYPGVQTVQIIYNLFRQRPAELFFPEAKRKQIGVIARLPLSSGALTGKMTAQTRFASDDHRQFNRRGESFDRGETFSGVDFDKQLEAVEQLRAIVPSGMTMAQFALRWILMSDAVTCAIPGARNPAQAEENIAASSLPALTDDTVQKAERLYQSFIRPLVHHYW
jgi:aryl-alcohol dehydrogenase-like predicted oxidoreductase